MNANNNPYNFRMNNGNVNIMNNNFNNQMIGINNNNYMNNINNFNCFQNQNMNMNMNNQINNFNQMNNNINIPNNNMNMNNNQNNILNNNNNNVNQNYFCNQFNNMNLNDPENIQLNLNNNNINKINDESDDENYDDDSKIFNNDKKRNQYDLYSDKELLKKAENLETTMEGIKIIYEQMKNCICHITNDYTGFFCHIPFMEKKIPVLITSSAVIDKNEIIVFMDDHKLQKKINLEKNKIILIMKNIISNNRNKL